MLQKSVCSSIYHEAVCLNQGHSDAINLFQFPILPLLSPLFPPSFSTSWFDYRPESSSTLCKPAQLLLGLPSAQGPLLSTPAFTVLPICIGQQAQKWLEHA